jgi:hypothetical protein
MLFSLSWRRGSTPNHPDYAPGWWGVYIRKPYGTPELKKQMATLPCIKFIPTVILCYGINFFRGKF